MPVVADTPFRQVNACDGALAGLAVELNRAAMQFDQSFRQRQPEPNPVMLARHAVADLSEWRQGDRNLVGRHPDAAVRDAEGDAMSCPVLDTEVNLSACRGKFDRIGEQVDEDLGQLRGICDDRWEPVFHLADELN